MLVSKFISKNRNTFKALLVNNGKKIKLYTKQNLHFKQVTTNQQ